ncbi:MAG TPA: MFS transporter, partial [Propionibacteriaceae bacterium]
LFPLRSSVVLLGAGMLVYMTLIPYAEAAEQTVLQKVVPYERQGRVFGFAQSVEQAASPLTAFLIGPLAEFLVIPSMTDGFWAGLIGSWFGTGPDRGMALVFVLTAILGLVATGLALGSRYYRLLRDRYAQGASQPVDLSAIS